MRKKVAFARDVGVLMDPFFNFGYGGHGGSMVGAIIERLLFFANTGIEKPMVSNIQTARRPICTSCEPCPINPPVY